MKTAEFIREHSACKQGAKWALSVSSDMAEVWDALVDQGKHEWLLWTATRPGVFTAPVLRKLACRFVRETPLHDGRTVWDLLADERSREAIEVAERYADGKATEAELDTARAAADAAAETTAYTADAADNAASLAADAVYAALATYHAARAAAYATAYAAYATARAAAYAAAYAAARAEYAAADAARAAAYDAQVKMIAELGNPFKKGATNGDPRNRP